MTERILALDPGGTTGWAYWQDQRFEGVEPLGTLWDQITCGQIGPHEHHLELYEHLERLATSKFTIVDESFQFRQMDNNRAGTNLMSREYIGVSKLFAAQRNSEREGSVQYTQQSPSEGKGFVSDEKLKIMGLWVPGQKHARDALRHLVYYLVHRRRMYNLIQSWQDL